MAVGYIDTPHNMAEIMLYVTASKEAVVAEIIQSKQCYFYDACSFRGHANLNNNEAEYLLKYIKAQKGIVVITRYILMELASHSGMLNTEYVEYIKRINEFGINVLVIYEEDLFSVMEMCFSTNEAINHYLCWAVRLIQSPVSTITKTLDADSRLYHEVIEGKNLDSRGIYKRFFQAARANKETGDNLGEELLAVCLHILSYLPGEEDGKFCVITDDKGAAGKMDTLFEKTAKHHKGKKIIIFSTPKLVQAMHRENILTNREDIKAVVSVGTSGNIVVLGTRIFDVRSREISINSDELADLIMHPNGINVIF